MSFVTLAQLDANIANAQLSTGPRTVEGRQRSARNAVTHAIFAKTIPARDQDAFLRMREQNQQDLRPKGAVEEQFVEAIADAQWRLGRVRELQDALLFAETETPEQQLNALNNYNLYENRLTRILQSNLKQLREIQQERRQREEVEMDQAARISKSLSTKDQAYDPASDGFVFSAADLAVWMRRNDRLDATRPGTFLGKHQVAGGKAL